jgi:DNA-binding beta-propeller fold protein YncE
MRAVGWARLFVAVAVLAVTGVCWGATYQVETVLSAPGCHYLDLSPDGTRLYAHMWYHDYDEGFRAFDTESLAFLADYHVGGTPMAGLVSADGKYLWATRYYGGYVSKVNLTTGALDKTIDVGSWACYMVSDSQRRYLYVGENTAGRGYIGSLQVIDTQTETVRGSLRLNGEPGTGMAMAPDDAYVYVIVWNTDTLYKIRTSDLTVAGTLTTAYGLDNASVSVSPDGRVAYLPEYSTNVVHLIDTATMTESGTWTLDGPAPSFFMSPDGSHALLNAGDATIRVFDVATKTVVQTIDLAAGLQGEAYFGGVVSWDTRRGRVYVSLCGAAGGVAVLVQEGARAEVDVVPDTLNPRSRGRYLTAYIELSEGYDVADIDAGSVCLTINQGETLIPAEAQPVAIGDYDSDGVPDLMVKFDRQAVQALLTPGETVTVYVGGLLADGTEFLGSDTVRVLRMVNISVLTFLGQVARAKEGACGAAQVLFDSLTSSSRRTGPAGGNAAQAVRLLDSLLRRSPAASLGAALAAVRQAVSDLAQSGAEPSVNIPLAEVQLYDQSRHVANSLSVLRDCYDLERRAWLTARRTFSSDCDLSGVYQSLDIEEAQMNVLSGALDEFRTLAGALGNAQRAQELTALADAVEALLLRLQDYVAAERAYVDSW